MLQDDTLKMLRIHFRLVNFLLISFIPGCLNVLLRLPSPGTRVICKISIIPNAAKDMTYDIYICFQMAYKGAKWVPP